MCLSQVVYKVLSNTTLENYDKVRGKKRDRERYIYRKEVAIRYKREGEEMRTKQGEERVYIPNNKHIKSVN